MTDVIRFRICLDNGAHLPLCSDTCTTSYHAALERAGIPHRIETRPVRQRASCATCTYCGRLVQSVGTCRWHGCPGEECPNFDWRGTECARFAVRMLSGMVPGRQLPDRCWEHIDEVAWAMHHSFGFPNPTALVKRVLDRRADWMPAR